MARLNYKDILNRVANRVGIVQPDNYQKLSIQQHIYDELIWIHARTEDKREVTAKLAIFDGLPPTQEPVVTVTDDPGLGLGDGMDLGEYIYKFAYRSALQGETETAFEISATITTAQQKVVITELPQLPHGVDSLIIYRTKSDGALFFLLFEKTDNLTYQVDTKKDTDLTVVYSTPTRYATESYLSFPDDYFLLRKASFFNEESVRLASKELPTEEEFIGYDPAPIQENSDSFRDVVNGTSPFTTPITEENIRYDGIVAYTIQDTMPPTFNFKPRFNGYLEWLYLAIPDVTFSNMSANPEMFYAFIDLLVTGATIRMTKVMMRNPDLKMTEAQINALVVTLRMDTDEYKNKMKNYAGYIKKTTDVHAVRGFNFLNDLSMDIGA